jgi:hypothetical protein
MTPTRKSTSRSNEGITVTISIRAKDEKAAKRILEHPSLKRLVEAFEADHKLGGQDMYRKHPFAHFSKEDFLSDVHLRTRAIRWLSEQNHMKRDDPERVIKTRPLTMNDHTFTLLMSNVPNLAAAYQEMTARLWKDGRGINEHEMKDSFGYKNFKLKEIREFLRKFKAKWEKVKSEKHDIKLRDLSNVICAWEAKTVGEPDIQPRIRS